jgi:phenylpyruvate tautomerase PptA (4-oxalocrotonate tautomerase family)
MPIITIKTLPLPAATNTSSLLKKICTDAAKTIGYDPQHIWATWEIIDEGNYAVGDVVADKLQRSTHSPIVRVLSFEGKAQEQVEKMLLTIAEVLSEGLNIDKENIFIEYAEARSGHVYDGGKIVHRK